MFEAVVIEHLQRASEVVTQPPPPGFGARPQDPRPVTLECFAREAARQSLEPIKLLSVMKVENGRVGTFSRNSNGTYDIGPMQINTVHLAEFSKVFGATESTLRSLLAYDGCFNVAVGAWLLRKRTNEAGGDFWYGIGNYHSKSPPQRTRYIRTVHKTMTEISREIGRPELMSGGTKR